MFTVFKQLSGANDQACLDFGTGLEQYLYCRGKDFMPLHLSSQDGRIVAKQTWVMFFKYYLT